tara:strand:+ start:152 stop:1573 length:1422 start_codon:yes stop_codon:yes gene_type:complete
MKKITFLLLTILPFIGIGQNLAPNPTLNGATNWSNLSAGNTQTYDAGLTRTADGSGSYLINSSGGFNSGIKSSNITQASLTAGEYLFSYYVYGNVGDKTKPIIRDNGTGTNIQGTAYTIQVDNTWEFVEQTFAISATGTINLRAMVNSDDISMDFHVDDFSLTYIPPGGNTLTVNVIGAGSVVKTLDQISYDPADIETLTANPSTHWNFDNWSGDLTGSTNPESILMDTDKTVTANFYVDPSFDYSFTFDTDGDLEGWTSDPQLSVASHTGGLVTLTPTTDQWARFSLFDFPIPSASYNKVTITLENNSTNDDQINVIVINGVDTEVLVAQTMTAGAGSYEFNLSAATNWTGDVDSIRIRFADADNPTAGRSSGTGNIIIDDIVFEFDLTLSTKDYNKVDFAMYPNPAKNVLNINSLNKISKISIFEITGKRVIEVSNLTNNKVNISQLNAGIYLVKAQDENNNISTKKLVID